MDGMAGDIFSLVVILVFPWMYIYGVEQNGDLRWYNYHGNGEDDVSGNIGWHQNSRNFIGNGWYKRKNGRNRLESLFLILPARLDLIFYFFS